MEHKTTEWVISPSQEESSIKISEYFSVSEITGQLLMNRELNSSNKIKSYLFPTYDMLHDPLLFNNMYMIVKRIRQAIKDKKTICIYGDYDADGATSTALLLHALKYLGADCIYFIPDRYTDGYGVNENAIKKLSDKGVSLIITVDCGITSIEEVNYARELDIDVIITDHHEPAEDVPLAYGILNPKIANENYPFKKLAGVGLAFKLAQALIDDKKFVSQLLDLVAIGTIVDIASIVDENRVLSALGLQQINENCRLGIKALYESSGNSFDNNATGSSLSFQIGPQINSAGRLNNASRVVELLTTDDRHLATQIATNLYETNVKRKVLEREIYQSIIENIDENAIGESIVEVVTNDNPKALGVIGIVASKLIDVYHRPVFVLCPKDELYAGSGRSIDGLNLADALTYCTDLLETHGGHQAAAGLSLKPDNLTNFKERLNEYISEHLESSDRYSKILVDMEVSLRDISIPLINEFSMFEPFGSENPEPLFVVRNVRVDNESVISMGQHHQHLKMKVTQYDTSCSLIMWGNGSQYDTFRFDDTSLDVVFSVQINRWKGIESVQLIAKDWRIL